MKEVKTKKIKSKEKNWVLSDTKLTQKEFVSGIQKAEEGPFFTVQESMEHFESWLKTREKNK
jgi:predicted transcriptional regulator